MSYAHILGTMYEHSSYYDKGFIIDELMLYHIIYDLYHDPYIAAIAAIAVIAVIAAIAGIAAIADIAAIAISFCQSVPPEFLR